MVQVYKITNATFQCTLGNIQNQLNCSEYFEMHLSANVSTYASEVD